MKDVDSIELRETNTDFHRQLSMEQEKAREDLMGRADDLPKDQEEVDQIKELEEVPVVVSKRSSMLTVTPPVASSHLRMPGSFED